MNIRNWIVSHKWRLIGALLAVLAVVIIVVAVSWAIAPIMQEDTPARVLSKQRFGSVIAVVLIVLGGFGGWTLGRLKE